MTPFVNQNFVVAQGGASMGIPDGAIYILLALFIGGISITLYLLNRFLFRYVDRDKDPNSSASIPTRIAGFIVGVIVVSLTMGLVEIITTEFSNEMVRLTHFVAMLLLLAAGVASRLLAEREFLSQGLSWGLMFTAIWGALSG